MLRWTTTYAAVLIFTPSFALPVKTRSSLSVCLDPIQAEVLLNEIKKCKSGFQAGITRRIFSPDLKGYECLL